MKKVMLFFACLGFKIKKNFFISGNNVTNQNCKENYRIHADKETFSADEYISNYKTTTRWQTL